MSRITARDRSTSGPGPFYGPVGVGDLQHVIGLTETDMVNRLGTLARRRLVDWCRDNDERSAWAEKTTWPTADRAARIQEARRDLLRKSWGRAIRRLDLPVYNPHDLRHKWTTVALTNGVSVHKVSRRLGHRSIEVTVDRYGHLTQDGQERCRQVVETAVGPYMLTAGRATAVRGAGSVPA